MRRVIRAAHRMARRRVAPGLALPLLVLPVLFLPALAAGSPVAPALRVEGIRFAAPVALRVSGQPLWLRDFSSRLPPGEAAARLRRLPVPLDRALRAPDGRLLLSGLSARWHWLVEIGPDGVGSRGRVSALCVGQCQPGEASKVPGPGLWEPGPGVRPGLGSPARPGLRVELSVAEPSGRMGWRVEALPADAAPALAALRQRLQQQGWRREGAAPGLAEEGWRRDGQRLYLRVLVLAGQGSVLLTRHE